jgi:predicted glycogen debranching enzyme
MPIMEMYFGDPPLSERKVIKLSQKILHERDSALNREWLAANGVGAYASSTVTGANTRRYHGLLVASFPSPIERQVVLAKVDEEILLGGELLPLGTNEFQDGTIFPKGFEQLQTFSLPLGIPTSEYLVGEIRLQKQVWMEQGRNTVYVKYHLLDAPSCVVLKVRPFCAFRGYHGDGKRAGESEYSISSDKCGAVTVENTAKPYKLKMAVQGGEFAADPDWYWNFLLRAERERGFPCVEDYFTPGVFSISISPGESVGFVASTEGDPVCPDLSAAYDREIARRQSIVKGEREAFRKDLFLAADQFVVRTPDGRNCIMAGYHWFTDWGRDTMIGLPGILLETGRFSEARSVLLEYASRVRDGLIPNRFTDNGEAEYNTADASLWFFETLNRYMTKSHDRQILIELMPKLEEIICLHTIGTRFGIGVDNSDGLLRTGTAGSQLTWMDARVGGVPVTPRIGKTAGINGLWYNALRLMAAWADELGLPSSEYSVAADKCFEGFNKRFWYRKGGYLFDVIDGPSGDDSSLRPNQIAAISVTFSPLEKRRWKSVVDTVEKHLLTPYGLRTLSPSDPRYKGTYSGSPAHRDAAYHQGTVWPWLLGPFADAHLKVYNDPRYIGNLLKELRKHLRKAGMGSISEVFSGDKPYKPGGCIAQAWSVGEVLRISAIGVPE